VGIDGRVGAKRWEESQGKNSCDDGEAEKKSDVEEEWERRGDQGLESRDEESEEDEEWPNMDLFA
jgi:hypothetical protein